MLCVERIGGRQEMKINVFYINPSGETEKVLCFGKNEKDLQEDVNKTLSRLGWDKTYCWSERID